MTLDWSLRKGLVTRKAALSSRTFIRSLASRGDQRPIAVRFWQHAPQPALEASEVMYSSGAGGLMLLPFTVAMLWSHH